MKKTLIFGLLFFSMISYGQIQADNTKKLLTSKYHGIYSYGKDVEKSRIGTIFIYPETDSTILFYIDLNRGAPSYNMGSRYGQLRINNGSGTFYTKLNSSDKGCKLTFLFSKKILTIKTADEQGECGFGYAVFADGIFKRTTNKMHDYFEDMEGKKIYFKKQSQKTIIRNDKCLDVINGANSTTP